MKKVKRCHQVKSESRKWKPAPPQLSPSSHAPPQPLSPLPYYQHDDYDDYDDDDGDDKAFAC